VVARHSPGREYAAKLKERDAAREMREDARRMREAEVRQMLAEWTTAHAQAARIRDEMVPLARARTETALAAYRGGATPLAAVLESRRAELDTELALVAMNRPPPARGPGSPTPSIPGAIMSSPARQRGTAAPMVIVALVVAALAAAAGFWFGARQGGHDAPAATSAAGSPAPAAATDATGNKMLYDDKGRRVLYWHDPMVPGQKFDKPGKSPFMDMQLVPVYADEGADEGTVR